MNVNDAYYLLLETFEEEFPHRYPEDGPTKESIGTARHGLEIPVGALAELLEWAASNEYAANMLAAKLRE